MADITYGKIAKDGLWTNNPGLVQLLGLCPLLAVSATFINALGLGLATTLVMIGSNITVSLIRDWVKPELRIPVFVMVIASFVTAVELGMSAYMHELYKILGIFIPLIVTNCIIIARVEAFASRNNVAHSAFDGLVMGLGFSLVLLFVGGLREIIGQGTLFAGADLMFGAAFEGAKVILIEDYRGFLFAILPPGAFFALGLLIAMKNIIDKRMQRSAARSVLLSKSEEANAAGQSS